MISHTRIDNLDGIVIDDFIRASLPYMDKNTYVWPEHCVDEASKLEEIHRVLGTYMAHQNVFIYTSSRDDYTLSVNFGLRLGTTFRALLSFIRPDANGARSFAYDPLFFQDWNDFLKREGFQFLEGLTVPSSGVRGTMRNFDITDEDYQLDGEVPGPIDTYVFRYEVK